MLDFLTKRDIKTETRFFEMRFLRYLSSFMVLVLLAGCGKQEEKKSYFKRDEFKQSKTFKLVNHMPYDELKEEKAQLVAEGNKYIAIKYVAQMIKKCEDPDDLSALRLEYADMLIDLERFEEAATEYQMFVQLYPASDQAPYADCRAIESLYSQVMQADRDQEKTHEVIEQAKDYAKKAKWHKDYDKYMEKVEDMTHVSLKRLYESELLRFYFYLNRGNCKAAVSRLKFIKENYLPYLDEIKPEVLELEYELACENKHPAEAKTKQQELKKDYPKYTCDSGKRRHYASLFTL